jgi:hypothetical protein
MESVEQQHTVDAIAETVKEQVDFGSQRVSGGDVSAERLPI